MRERELEENSRGIISILGIEALYRYIENETGVEQDLLSFFMTGFFDEIWNWDRADCLEDGPFELYDFLVFYNKLRDLDLANIKVITTIDSYNLHLLAFIHKHRITLEYSGCEKEGLARFVNNLSWEKREFSSEFIYVRDPKEAYVMKRRLGKSQTPKRSTGFVLIVTDQKKSEKPLFYKTLQRQLRRKKINFTNPWFPNIKENGISVEYLSNSRELCAHALSVKNCLFSYIFQILDGEFQAYRIVFGNGELGTVMFACEEEKYVCRELELNGSISVQDKNYVKDMISNLIKPKSLPIIYFQEGKGVSNVKRKAFKALN